MNEQQAQLHIVQPGSRSNFRVRVFEAMQARVTALSGFVLFQHETPVTRNEERRWVAGQPVPIDRARDLVDLERGFQLPAPSASYHVHSGVSASAGSDHDAVPYRKSFAAYGPQTQAIIASFYNGPSLLGVCGIERAPEDIPFSTDDILAIEALAPYIAARINSVLDEENLRIGLAAWRSFIPEEGDVYVIDRVTQRLIFASTQNRYLSEAEAPSTFEGRKLLTDADAFIAARKAGVPFAGMTSSSGNVADAVLLEEGILGNECVVIRIEPFDSSAHSRLSKREKEVARLLSSGFSTVNVAAIVGLSENTVRTYVRRVYQKLGIANRADLVRSLISPPSRP